MCYTSLLTPIKKFQNFISNSFIYHKTKVCYINLFPLDFIYHNRVLLTSDLHYIFMHINRFFNPLAPFEIWNNPFFTCKSQNIALGILYRLVTRPKIYLPPDVIYIVNIHKLKEKYTVINRIYEQNLAQKFSIIMTCYSSAC